jgi:arabinose-5-phosphate isomerase
MPLVESGTLMKQAILEMTAKGLGCVGIVDAQDLLLGIITDGDLRRHMAPDLLDQPVERVMTREPRTIRAQATIAEAIGLMTAKELRPITSLFVVDEGRPVGLLHMHDCLRAGAL